MHIEAHNKDQDNGFPFENYNQCHQTQGNDILTSRQVLGHYCYTLKQLLCVVISLISHPRNRAGQSTETRISKLFALRLMNSP
jgi:hypothetical protein